MSLITQYTTDLSESNLRKRPCTHFPLSWSCIFELSQSKPIVALGFQPIANVLCLQNIILKVLMLKILEASFSDTLSHFGQISDNNFRHCVEPRPIKVNLHGQNTN